MRKVGKKAPRPFDRLAEAAAEQSSRRVTNNITRALCNDICCVSRVKQYRSPSLKIVELYKATTALTTF